MSERKVQNKYIPIDYDPNVIPKSQYKGPHQYKTRIMQPFNVQCLSCRHFMYRGRKFNAKKETTSQRYLGIAIFRFFFRCENCANQITFQTDPKNFNYTCESGAERMFEFTYEKEQAIERIREIQDIDGNDIVKIMEDRTKESMRRKRAEDVQDQLEDLRKENDEIDVLEKQSKLQKEKEEEQRKKEKEEEERDEEEVKKFFENGKIKDKVQEDLYNDTLSIDDTTNNDKNITKDIASNDDDNDYEIVSEDEASMFFGCEINKVPEIIRKKYLQSRHTDDIKKKTNSPTINISKQVNIDTTVDRNNIVNKPLNNLHFRVTKRRVDGIPYDNTNTKDIVTSNKSINLFTYSSSDSESS